MQKRQLTPKKHDTRIMIGFDWARSTVLLTYNVSFDGLQNGGMLFGNVM